MVNPFLPTLSDTTCRRPRRRRWLPSYMASSLPILLALSSLSTLSAAYTWNFNSPPQQCSNLTVSLVGSGVPPYRILVLPSGPTPLSSGIEVRRILDVPFPDGSTTVSFQLKYPANSQLVAVVSIYLSIFFHSLFSFIFCYSHFCFVFCFLFLFFCCCASLSRLHLSMPGSHSMEFLGFFSRHLASFYNGRWFLCHSAPRSTDSLFGPIPKYFYRHFRLFLIACWRLLHYHKISLS